MGFQKKYLPLNAQKKEAHGAPPFY